MEKLTPNTALALMQASQTQSAQAASAAKSRSMEAIDAAAQDFEAVFISEMMKPMFEGLEPDPLTGGGKAEQVYNDMMIQEYGKVMAQTGQIGIAQAVKEEMIRMQEAIYVEPDTEADIDG